MNAPRKLSLALHRINRYGARNLQAPAWLKLTLGIVATGFLASCAIPRSALETAARHRAGRMHVRTTAYCPREIGGHRNAVGERLSGRYIRSAAADWSRFPLGTRFKIVGENDEYIIDDYGTALIGTNTIDIYKTTTLEMRRWGVRQVDIDILHWGSDEESAKVLKSRARHASARRMLAALEKKKVATSDRPL